MYLKYRTNYLRTIMELYFSVDIETDGPIPGRNSMLSLGAAAFKINEDGSAEIVSTWSSNFETLPEASANIDTMNWWKTQNEAWEVVQKDKRDPKDAMVEFVQWVKQVSKENKAKPVFVAYPAGFDFTFVIWYMHAFVGESPFSFSCLDMKSYAMAKLGKEFHETSKRNMPSEWFSYKNKHTHIALEDAIEQGWMFVEMMKK